LDHLGEPRVGCVVWLRLRACALEPRDALGDEVSPLRGYLLTPAASATATARMAGRFVEALPLTVGQGMAQRGEYLPDLERVHVTRGPVVRASAHEIEVGEPVER